MTDQFDRATEIEEAQREDALEQHRWRRQSLPAVSSRVCRVCDEPIPVARRRAVPGCATCIDCQRDLEYGMTEGLA